MCLFIRKYVVKYGLSIGLTIWLTGCGPILIYDVPEFYWDELTDDEKVEVMQRYYSYHHPYYDPSYPYNEIDLFWWERPRQYHERRPQHEQEVERRSWKERLTPEPSPPPSRTCGDGSCKQFKSRL